jgi:methylglutaconyl-CoA hydratase
MRTVSLYRIAHGRSGDKGDTVNVGVIARRPEFYDFLVRVLTPERVKAHFGSLVNGSVQRFELPNLHALNFLLHEALGGGGTVSLMTDAQGKTFSTAMLRMQVELPDELVAILDADPSLPAEPAAGFQRRSPMTSAIPGPYQRIVYQVDDGIARLTLNRPEKRNALDAETIQELTYAVLQADADAGVRVMLLAGNGPDFCAGADLAQLQRIATGGDPMENLADAQSLGQLFIAMRRASRPIVAAVHGHTIAGGAGLATAADVIVASSNTTFGYPEVLLGFVPAMVLVMLRRTLGEKATFELTTTGRRFDAEEAYRLGLVSRVFPAADFTQQADAFVRELAARSASAVSLIKRMLYGSEGLGFEDAIARGADINVIARTTPDCQEGVRRFLERNRR